MAVIKCESCGAPLEFAEGMSVAKCEWCGYSQTIPLDIKGMSTDEMIEWAKKYRSNLTAPRDMQKALLWYEKAAQAGDFSAERECAIIYGEGMYGIAKDINKAEEYYTRAANHGDKRAAQLLGCCYMEGRNGFPVDEEKGFYWIKKSADSGFSPAFCTLGWCYHVGKGVEKDYKVAIQWYEKAAKEENSCAMGNLAELYFDANGQNGVATDYFEAVEWAEKAIEASRHDSYDVANAYYVLGNCTLYGKGTTKDPLEALSILKKADSKGSSDASYLLGCIYENSAKYGLEEYVWDSSQDAYKYYLKSAKLNHPDAQEAVSRCFRNGTGIDKNAQQAEKWHKKAVENGYSAKSAYTPENVKSTNTKSTSDRISSEKSFVSKSTKKKFFTKRKIIIGIVILLIAVYFLK